jgi:hypothetical protein
MGNVTEWIAGIKCRLFLPRLGAIRNTARFRVTLNCNSLCVHSSLPISVYMWNIDSWSAKYLVSNNFKWPIWVWSGHNRTTCRGGAARRSAFSVPLWKGESLLMRHLPHLQDNPGVHWPAFAEMSLSIIGKLANPPKYVVASHSTTLLKLHHDPLYLLTLTKHILAIIYQLTML